MSFIKTPLTGAARTAALAALLSAAAILPLTVSSASAHEYEAGSLHIEHPWARATPPRAGVAGAYMMIENNGREADRLLGGTTDAAREVQIHSMSMDGGVMKMRQLSDGLELPAGKAVTLAPGGYHLMLIDPVKPLKEGERVPMTLQFQKAGTVEVDLDVEGMGARGPEGRPEDASHDHGMNMDGNASSGMNMQGGMDMKSGASTPMGSMNSAADTDTDREAK